MELALHDKQLQLLDSIGLASELFFGGAAGGGKSFTLRAVAIIYAMEVPGVQIYLFRRQYKDLKRSHMSGAGSFPDLLKEFVDDKIVKINHSDNEIVWSNGSKIVLSHIQFESDLENYLSQEINIALFDEASTFTEKMFRFIRSRVRLGGLIVPEQFKGKLPFIVLASNPRGPMHGYLKRAFVDAAMHETPFQAPMDDGGATRIFIPSKLHDNPTLIENDPDYSNRLMGLGDPDIVKAYLEGDWSAVEGAAFPMWDPSIHIIEPFNIPIRWKIRRGYDYGFSAPYSVLWMAESNGEIFLDAKGEAVSVPKGSIFIINELYGDNGREEGIKEDVRVTASKILDLQKSHYPYHMITSGPADNAIFSKEQGPSISSLMESAGVQWYAADKSPGSRVNGLMAVRTLLFESKKRIPERPCLYVFSNCKRLLQHLPNLQLDSKSGEDVETKGQPEHDWDALRYLVLDVTSEVQEVKVSGF